LVHVVVISLICTDGDKLEKEMRRIYQVKETDMRGDDLQTWDGVGLAGEKNPSWQHKADWVVWRSKGLTTYLLAYWLL
jgi:hypothetical protein